MPTSLMHAPTVIDELTASGLSASLLVPVGIGRRRVGGFVALTRARGALSDTYGRFRECGDHAEAGTTAVA